MAEKPEVFGSLMEIYASAAPGLACLQEVHRPDLAEEAARRLGLPAWLHAPGGLRPDYGCAVLGADGVALADLTREGGTPLHDRVHVRASVPWNGAMLEVAVIHLPSNRYAASPEEGEAARMAELERVLGSQPMPDVVLGDMNCLPESGPYRLMERRGYVDAATAGGREPGSGRRIDYVWLSPASVRRLAKFERLDRGPFQRADAQDSPWRLSDHPPLLAELR